MGRRYLAAALRRAVPNARAPLLAVILALLLSGCSPDRPDFSSIRDVPTLKGAFAEFLLPMIASENARLSEQRNTLTGLHNTFRQQGDLGWWATRRLQRLAAEYALETEALSTEAILDELALRIDIIPADLALMQAAKESGWGRSRFAVEHNNLFGHWCYVPGCGVIPKQRASGARHEVAHFDSVQQSIRRYMHNLNSHPRYADFRALRAQRREQHVALTGNALAEGLLGYSERGALYVAELKTLLRQNHHLLSEQTEQ